MADSATYSVLFMFKRYGCPMFVASGYINANKDIIKQSSQLDTSMMHPPPGGKAQLVCIEGLSIVICPKYSLETVIHRVSVYLRALRSLGRTLSTLSFVANKVL